MEYYRQSVADVTAEKLLPQPEQIAPTQLDLVIVYLVTHPIVAMVSTSKSSFLSNPRHLGLGAVQQVGAQRKTSAVGRANVKEA